ncbi:MAG: DinB family protein [Alphaproteobacteria bacterium]
MSASLLTELLQFSRYNRIANRVLYAFCAGIPEDALSQAHPKTGESILGIFNHILIVDRDWMNRFTGVTEENAPRGSMLHDDFSVLRDARTKEDERIEEFIESLSIAFLSSQFRYKDSDGNFHQDPADRLVVHMFNNQTHHRGRIELLLTELGKQPPALDFHILLRH